MLRNGLQLHYLTNNLDPDSPKSPKPLVILVHGYPDSCLMWRHMLGESTLLESATIVAVDLPGYGGSDSFSKYGTEEVLEALAEFIVGVREKYIDPEHRHSDQHAHRSQVYLVGHDWGCALAYRLAAEAPGLADRYIVMNGPLVRDLDFIPDIGLSSSDQSTSFP